MKENFKPTLIFIEKNSKIWEMVKIFSVFLLNLFLVLSRLLPKLYEINPHDGAKYIESGRLLLTWGLRDLAWGPLVAFIYAPIHLFVGQSPYWFMIEAWVGNIILFGLIWFGFYMLANEFKAYLSMPIFIGVLFSSTIFFPVLENQSDALFVALSSFALTNLIRFYKTSLLKYVWFASLFVGLGVMTRVESILLVIPLLFFSLLVNQREKEWYKVLFSSIFPIIFILFLFVTINLIVFGHPNLGMGGKSYDSFLMNQAFFSNSRNQQAYFRGENLFGTMEENQRSVLRAILRNPFAIVERALVNLLSLPKSFMLFFGDLQAPIILLFSLWGLMAMIVKKAGKMLVLLLVWPLHSLVSLIFLPRHIIPQSSYLFMILCAIGITYLFSEKERITEKLILFVLTMILILGALAFQNKILISAGVLMTIVLITSLLENGTNKSNMQTLPLLLLLIGGLMFRDAFVFPVNLVGKSEELKAIGYLQTIVSEQSKILVPLPSIATASKLEDVVLPKHIQETNQLIDFLVQENIDAIFLDENWPEFSEFIRAVAHKYPDYLNLIYESGDGNIEIFLINS